MFANFDCVLNGEDFWGSVKNGITEDTATHWIRHIVRLDNTQVSVASSIPKTFEGKCAYDELMYAQKALEKMTDKCKSEITTLEKIGGKVRTAIIEHNDAIQQYNAALSRIRSAIEVINYWGLYNDELY